MPIAMMGVSRVESIIQLLGLLILFLLIVVATYFTTRWVGTYGNAQAKNKNITVIETFRINQNKFIQILKITDKYIAVAVTKDHVEFLTEIDETKIVSTTGNTSNLIDFKDILNKIIPKDDKNKK